MHTCILWSNDRGSNGGRQDAEAASKFHDTLENSAYNLDRERENIHEFRKVSCVLN